MMKSSKARYKVGDVLTHERGVESVLILASYVDLNSCKITVKVKLLDSGYVTSVYESAFYKHYAFDAKATILFGGGQKNGGGLI